MKAAQRSKLFAWLVGLFVVQFLVHGLYVADKWSKSYASAYRHGMLTEQLDPSQIMLELFGFREFLARILWVRADDFFDEGNYDAVLPIVRLCTILDPKNLDVYSTGMWHIAYNFTDDDQRSDRRYIAPALALGKEGSKQNPETYECFFETGWIWYNKVDDDYDKSVYWFNQAVQRDDILPARRNLLTRAYLRNNQVPEALDYYYTLLDYANKDFEKNNTDYVAMTQRETIEGNLDNLITRMVQRGWVAQRTGTYGQGDYDTKPPFDVGFSARISVEDPKVLRFQGTWNVLPVGTRIRVVVRDEDIVSPDGRRIDGPAKMDWDYANSVNLDPPKEVTYMQDECYVKNRHFDKRDDLSKDPTMYPFSRRNKRFAVEFYYNPRSSPDSMQDKFGFNGEGFTDKNFLSTDARPGQRVVFWRTYLTYDQIWRTGEWEHKTPIISTPNFESSNISADTNRIITLSPSIRGK